MPTWSGILSELQQLTTSVQAGKVTLPPGNSIPDVVRRKYLTAVHTITGRPVILYASKWTQGPVQDPDTISMVAEDVQGFMEVMHNLPGDGLDIILHLPGGSAEATEAIVTYLRSKFTNIRVFIPQAAMSAATMLTCAADRVVMGKHSSIGPIDPQFVLRTEVGIQVAPAHAILEQFKMAQKECQNPQLLASWVPILRQYGPSLLVQCRIATELSQSLVGDWLARYMFRGQDPAAAKALAESIAKTLGSHADFMSHSRFISRDRARSLGLLVDDLEADQKLQDAVLSVFHATTHTFGATQAVKIIENHLNKAFVKIQRTVAFQMPVQIPQPPAPAAP